MILGYKVDEEKKEEIWLVPCHPIYPFCKPFIHEDRLPSCDSCKD